MTTASVPAIDVRRADARFRTDLGWLRSWHSFSFGDHHDPDNTGHGLLVVSNDDVVAGGTGFGMHPHRDMEIITWVLDGKIEHRDSRGNHGVIYPGLAQHMSAGSGIWHSEVNPDPDKPVHLVQMWVLPDTRGIAPAYHQKDVSDVLARGGMQVIASGRGDGAFAIQQKDARLLIGRLAPGERASVAAAPHAHVFVARGTAALEKAGDLAEGDAVRLSAAGPLSLAAGPAGAEVLVWETA